MADSSGTHRNGRFPICENVTVTGKNLIELSSAHLDRESAILSLSKGDRLGSHATVVHDTNSDYGISNTNGPNTSPARALSLHRMHGATVIVSGLSGSNGGKKMFPVSVMSFPT